MKIIDIKEGCSLYEAGVRVGDQILKVNGEEALDFLDLFYYKDEPCELEIKGNGVVRRFMIDNLNGLEVDVDYRGCENRCSFCFVDGLPKGLRKSLYFKDDDYRLSFLFGNYITMTNLSDYDFDRINRLRLTPLYISVHATDEDVRKEIFGNEKAGEVLDQLKKFAEFGTAFHTQIVVVPGLNDGEVIFKTINDLLRFIPYLESIAIVPAGRTKYNANRIPETTKKYARDLIEGLVSMKETFVHEKGHDIIQISDEYYLASDLPFPDATSYGNFPQIENGCGMVVKLLKELREAPKVKRSPEDLHLVTSVHPRFFLKSLIDHLAIPIDRVLRIANDFFGPTIWVSGLLTGQDIRIATDSLKGRFLIPNDTAPDGTFLDGVRIEDHPNWILAPACISDLTRLVESL